MKIITVNVIQKTHDDVILISSYVDNVEGNKEAEEFFKRVLKRLKVNEVDIESYIEDGFYNGFNGYKIYLAHSN